MFRGFWLTIFYNPSYNTQSPVISTEGPLLCLSSKKPAQTSVRFAITKLLLDWKDKGALYTSRDPSIQTLWPREVPRTDKAHTLQCPQSRAEMFTHCQEAGETRGAREVGPDMGGAQTKCTKASVETAWILESDCPTLKSRLCPYSLCDCGQGC